MKMSKNELQLFSVIVAVIGLFLVISGTVMNHSKKTITKKVYSVNVSMKQISQVQAKKNEVILKDIL